MIELNWSLVFTIINIIILYLLMKKFLFGPITSFMENRTKGIQSELDNAEQKLKEAENTKKEYEEILKGANQKAMEIIEKANERGSKDYEQHIANAKKDADAIIKRGEESIQIERQKMMREVRNEVASVAFAVASKMIGKNIDTSSNKQIVDKFLDDAGVA